MRVFNMRSSAVFLIADLSVAIAKPVAQADISNYQGTFVASNTVDVPGTQGSADDDIIASLLAPVFTGSGTTSYDFKTNEDVNVYDTLPQVPSMTDSKTTISLGTDFAAPFSNDFLAQKMQPSNSNPDREFVSGPEVDWSSHPQFQVDADRNGLHYPNPDAGVVTFICYPQNFLCCNTYGSLEQKVAEQKKNPDWQYGSFKLQCRSCMYLTSHGLLVSC